MAAPRRAGAQPPLRTVYGQNKRDRGHNVIDVDYNKNEIIDAVNTVLKNGKSETSAVYGGGNAGLTIADLLIKVPLQFHKTIMY